MSKHTKGPWSWVGDGILANQDGDEIINSAITLPGECEIDQANARLMEVAPDLFHACELFIQWSKLQPVIQINGIAVFELAMRTALDAIKKVEGKK